MSKQGELTAEEAERVRVRLRELLDQHEGNKSDLGRLLKLTSQGIGKQTRADHPERPGLETARKVAKYLKMPVWELLWPESAAGVPPPALTHFELAADVARREGWPDELIERFEKQAAFAPNKHTPFVWLKHMDLANLPASNSNTVAPPREQIREADLAPKVPRAPSFAERLATAMSIRGWDAKKLSSETRKRGALVRPDAIRLLLDGKTLGQMEDELIERLRAALTIDRAWLGSPAKDVVAARVGTRS